MHEEQPIDLAFAVGVGHRLDRADQILDLRGFAQVARGGHHVDVEAAEVRDTLRADDAQIGLDALLLPLT
ncbi:hypothetical protein D3C83_84280 [compost metagenome]